MKDNPLGSPWYFEDEYPSPNTKYKLVYEMVGEVAMGAPLAGICKLVHGNRTYSLRGSFGGPVVWNQRSDFAALPYWGPGRMQRLAIVNIPTLELWLSQQVFRVIELTHVKQGVIYGIDSPIYQAKKIVFDPSKEAFEHRMKIHG